MEWEIGIGPHHYELGWNGDGPGDPFCDEPPHLVHFHWNLHFGRLEEFVEDLEDDQEDDGYDRYDDGGLIHAANVLEHGDPSLWRETKMRKKHSV